MPQTLLAFLAVLLMMTFALNQQRALILSRAEKYQGETQMVATELAERLLSEISTKKFDENTNDSNPLGVSVCSLTDEDDFGGTPRKDIDDYDGFDEEAFQYQVNDEVFEFDLEVTVTYAPPFPSTSTCSKSRAKTVTVRVAESGNEGNRYVQLKRTYTLAASVIERHAY